MAYSSSLEARGRRRRPRIVLWLLLIGAGVLALSWWRVGAPPELDLRTSVPGIGASTTVTGGARQTGRGLAGVRMELVQGERSWTLAEVSHRPREFWKFWGKRTTEDTLEAVVGPDFEDLEEGEARLRLVADRATTWIRRPAPTVLERTVPVRFQAPSLDLGSHAVRVRQGGSGLVTYRIGERAVVSGVDTGAAFFPGRELPGGGPLDRFALFAVPYDNDDPAALRLVVRDDLGNELRSSFLTAFTAKPLKRSEIRLDDDFLEKVVGEIGSRTPGLSRSAGPLEAYLEINGELRRRNGAELAELAESSADEFLWTRAFRQQPNSQLMDDFAARRTYLYEGREVDTQDHLGFDLASVRRAPVVASNAGNVVLARYFGIYGNTVVLDHGYGLQSLYAHLSSIAVEEGTMVEQGATVGRSGETGLAGGDHLHFSILVGGRSVDPREWFDARWIETRIAEPLPAVEFDLD